jgi:hypothetical protein
MKSQASVRRANHCPGGTLKPLALSDRRMISRFQALILRSAAELLTGISATGEDVTQPGEPIVRFGEDSRGAVTVLDVGCMDERGHEEAFGIREDMPFASLHLLAVLRLTRPLATVRLILPLYSTTFCCLHALAVDHASCRLGRAACCLTRFEQKVVTDFFQQAQITPVIEILLDRRKGRSVFGQHPPRATGRNHVEQRIDDLAKVGRASANEGLCRRQMKCDQSLFRIRKVACIARAIALILWPCGLASPVSGSVQGIVISC